MLPIATENSAVNSATCSMSANTHHIIHRENARPAFQLAPPPILVSTINNLDDIPLFKRELAWLSRLECVQSTDASDDIPTGWHCSSSQAGSSGRSRRYRNGT